MAASVSAISQVVDLIQKNRFAAPSLNYKLETFRLSTTMPQVVAAQRAAAEKQARDQLLKEDSPGAASSGSQSQSQQQQSSSGAASGGAKAAGGGAGGKTSAAAAAANAAAALLAQQQQQQQRAAADTEATLQAVFAENVAVRAKHHGARTVLLGVGSSGGHGKALVLGGFARATVERVRGSKEVDCVAVFKPSGPPVRSTQPMRVVIVVTPTTGIDVVRASLAKISNLSLQRGDYVGLLVVMNSARAKPKSLVAALAALEQQRQQQAALGVGQSQQVQPPTSQEQLAMIKVDEEGPEAGPFWRKTIESTLKLAGDVSRLGFLNQEERLQQIQQEQQQQASGGGGDSARSGGDAVGSPGPLSSAVAPSVVLSTTTAAATTGFEGPHLLATFWIEPTNRDAAPELESHTGCAQLAKAAAGLKTDYLVVPRGTDVLGPNATGSVLSAVRPHILLM
jgi:hypothetical protein